MPALVSRLIDEIRAFADSSYGGFKGFPKTDPEAGLAWSTAAQNYLAGLSIPPPTNPARHELAAKAMLPLLIGISLPNAFYQKLPPAFTAAAALIAAQSVPVAIPPVVPLFIPPMGPIPSALPPITILATLIDTWLHTGLYGTPPSPPVIPWL